MSKPRFTPCCAALFAERGNEWLTQRDKERDFPTSHPQLPDTPRTDNEEIMARIRHDLRRELGKGCQDFAPPKPSFHVDPDMDAFTKASRAPLRNIFKDPTGTPIVADATRRKVNILLKMRREINARKPIKVK